MPYYIAFDVSHKPRGKIDENMSELRDHLNSNDFVCYNFLETPITHNYLKPYDILVFACPDFSKLSHQEIMEIINWVKEDGGGLLMLSHAGGDRGRNSNLGEISEHFGIAFEGDQVLDEIHNIGMENMPIITADHFIPPHPLTNGINEICYRAGCSLTVLGEAISVVSSNETSEPFSCPLICASEPDNGRVVAIGSYEMFRDRTGGGFQYDDHPNLALNIFNWLISDYRMELTEQGKDHSKTTAPSPASIQSSQEEEYSSPVSPIPSIQSQNFESQNLQSQNFESVDISLKISSKSELIGLLKNVLNQVNNIKYTIEHIINAATDENADLYSLKDQEIPQGPINYQDYQYSEDTSDYLKFSKRPLTNLPPKPTELDKVDSEEDNDELFIGLEPIDPAEIEKTSQTISRSYVETNSETIGHVDQDRDKLVAELEGLENKLNSVFNLINFIEKKHDSGKLDSKSYKKQTKKLERDLEQTQKRIEEIKSQLG